MITGLLHYLSHPEVDIDPAVPVPDWRLNRRGLARVTALAARGWPRGVSRVISSAERKAHETAAILASALGVSPEARHAQNEIDRSATGYVPHDRHEALADQFFAFPDVSADGWERARDAQARVLSDLEAVFAGHCGGDILIVGHGGVGTLLLCQFVGGPIARHDQRAGGGCWFTVELASRRLALQSVTGWRPIEELPLA